jgi:signal transduction histidine kinase
VSARAGPRIGGRLAALGVGQLLALSIGVLLVLAAAGIGLAIAASARLSNQRTYLLDRVGPSNRSAIELENALVNQETGLRGYLITIESSFLAPYGTGLRAERAAYRILDANARADGAPVPEQLAAVRAATLRWREGFARRALAEPRAVAAQGRSPDEGGKELFDSVRSSLAKLQATLRAETATSRSRLDNASNVLEVLLIVAAVLVLGSVLGAGLLLRRTITRPLARLGAASRRVAGGDFERPLPRPRGPREVRLLSAELEGMRERIVEELERVERGRSQLEEQALELSRSNADLEQFAYVASHDLQEPLRKVTSFCQALQSRYGGQLDERADQYIEFAVDGAKRMQVLINDLLAFSRVGRSGREYERVALGDAVAGAIDALSEPIESSGARVEADGLPTVEGDEVLLRSLFQNLIANAIKFRGEQPPVVRISATRDGSFWQIEVADNGIGIEREYAERIFLIFQRLHPREAFEGSGIGLALCRKIVEYHGGRIWLDTESPGGARFHLTLPVAKEDT